jgi:lipoate-protein ligase A
VLEYRISWEEAASAFVQAFVKTLNLSFVESELSSEELSRADTLVKNKYAHPGWIERI